MSKYQMLHETVVKDIIDIYDTIKSDAEAVFKGRSKSASMRSVASASSGLTMVFPCLGSRSISISALSMVNKAQERKITTMLQMLFSAIQVTDSGDAFEYLSQFHNNLSTKFFTVDDAMELMGKITESGTISSYERIKESARHHELSNMVLNDWLRNCDYTFGNPYSEHSINDYKVHTTPYNRRVTLEADNDSYGLTPGQRLERFKDMEVERREKFSMAREKNKREIEKHDMDREYHTDRMMSSRIKRDLDTGSTAKNREEARVAKLRGLEVMQKFNQNQLLDADVRKANELMPTMMSISFKTKDGDGRIVPVDNVVCGVKCKLYALDSNDVMDHIMNKTYDKNFILGLVKASTREISFWKDFVLALDRAKVDALSYSRKSANAKLWKVLERRSLKSRIRRMSGTSNDASAISTLIISQNEVEYLRKEYNIDVEKLDIARNLLESYNLMSLVIVDEDLEVCKFLYDSGDDLWESVSFNHLERESSDNTYKRVVNMMTKLR